MRRRRIPAAPDYSSLSEPWIRLGPLSASFLDTLLLLLALGAAGKGGPAGLALAAFLAGLALAPKRPYRWWHILAAALSGVPRKPRQESTTREEYTIKADVLPVQQEISGFIVDPRTGEPYEGLVVIIVDGQEILVPARQGRYSTIIELAEGTHEIVVRLGDPPVELKRVIIRVVQD